MDRWNRGKEIMGFVLERQNALEKKPARKNELKIVTTQDLGSRGN
jgi:hypothetical protein